MFVIGFLLHCIGFFDLESISLDNFVSLQRGSGQRPTAEHARARGLEGL